MKTKLNVIFLLAGTAIGSGMIALPIVLAKFGIINTCLIMLCFSALTYTTALIRADLNLNSSSDATLKDVGNKFGEILFGNIGHIALLLLSFALMSAYIFGLSSMLYAFCNHMLSQKTITIIFATIAILAFLRKPNALARINNALFVSMFSALFLASVLLLWNTQINILPLHATNITSNDLTTLVPIIFTSFGFQGSIHSATKLCNNNKKIIKSACFWGSIIPAIVYIIWTFAVLVVISNTNPEFFNLMIQGNSIDVGELIKTLTEASSFPIVQNIIWIVSIFAILTSIFGVGLALLDVTQQEAPKMRKSIAAVMIVAITTIIGIITPNAFVRILNIAGIMLALIAIISPVVIHLKMTRLLKSNVFIKKPLIIFGVLACGICIIISGVLDLLN